MSGTCSHFVSQEADIRVAGANPLYGERPYTVQTGGCGEMGEYIHVTPDYLLKVNETTTATTTTTTTTTTTVTATSTTTSEDNPPSTTSEDGETTNEAAITTEDGELTSEATAKPTTTTEEEPEEPSTTEEPSTQSGNIATPLLAAKKSLPMLEPPSTTFEEGETTSEAAVTTEDGETTDVTVVTTEEGDMTSGAAVTTEDDETTSEGAVTTDGEMTTEAAVTTEDSQTTSEAPVSTTTSSPPGNTFLHEWSKLRYGVFEQYGYPGDARYPAFYEESDGDFSPNYCTNVEIEGAEMDIVSGSSTCQKDEDGSPDENCVFVPSAEGNDNENVTSCFMSAPFLPSVSILHRELKCSSSYSVFEKSLSGHREVPQTS